MSAITVMQPNPPIMREYDIKGTKYIVSATTKNGAREDAAAIVRRLLRKDVSNKLSVQPIQVKLFEI